MGTAREGEEKEEGDYLDDITMRVWRTSGVVVCDVVDILVTVRAAALLCDVEKSRCRFRARTG
jgi:hypothetical protein